MSLSNNGTELNWDPPAKVCPTAASNPLGKAAVVVCHFMGVIKFAPDSTLKLH